MTIVKDKSRTYSARKEDFPLSGRKWYIIDAEDKVLGRVATRVANALRGKDKPEFTPHVDTGSFVVVINADKIKLTGNKLDQKIYYRHSGYLGSLRSTTAREMLAKKPEQIVIRAVEGMLPRNKLSRAVIKKLKVYSGSSHPHEAQRPVPMEV